MSSEPAPSAAAPSPKEASKHTPGNTVYLITGANSGIGSCMVHQLLALPQHTIIMLHRPASAVPPAPATAHASSCAIAVHYTAAQTAADVHWLASTLRDAHGIERIDVVVASAGMATSLRPLLATPWREVDEHLDVNLGGPFRLVQGLRALLGLEAEPGHAFPPPLAPARAQRGARGSVVVLVSSSLGSIGQGEPRELPGFAYGASKAALNYLAARLHGDFSPAPNHLCAFALHPGWVRTRMGQQAARAWGMPADTPPLTAEDSAAMCLAVIRAATVDTHGGHFWTYEGKKMGW